jgi:hypothetical protein
MSPLIIISVKKYRDISHAAAERMPNGNLMESELKMSKRQIADIP